MSCKIGIVLTVDKNLNRKRVCLADVKKCWQLLVAIPWTSRSLSHQRLHPKTPENFKIHSICVSPSIFTVKKLNTILCRVGIFFFTLRTSIMILPYPICYISKSPKKMDACKWKQINETFQFHLHLNSTCGLYNQFVWLKSFKLSSIFHYSSFSINKLLTIFEKY